MKSILLVGVLILVASVVCVAGNTSASEDECPCVTWGAHAQEEPEVLLEQESGGQMEWVCETYRYVVCDDYDTEPCAWCVIPCQTACGFCLAIPNLRLAAACFGPCIAGCAAGCPECEYCVEAHIEEVIVCGWVLAE